MSCREFEIRIDEDLLRGDMSPIPMGSGQSIDECCELCARTVGCRGLTLTPSGDCWLKDSIYTPTKQRGLVSGLRRGWERMREETEEGGEEGGGVSSRSASSWSREEGGGAALGEGDDVMLGGSVRTERGRVNARAGRVNREKGGSENDETRAVKDGTSLTREGGSVAQEGGSRIEGGSVHPEEGGLTCTPSGCMQSPALVVVTHARADMVTRALSQLSTMALRDRFTVYVADDAGAAAVREAASMYGFVKEVLVHPTPTPSLPFHFSGLWRISEHFRTSLDAVISQRGHSHALMVEDDLLLSPDFLLLFWQSAWLLHQDPSLWCVSAWNDQGFPHTSTDPRELMRTDFFPGLGWMIQASTWKELSAVWPAAPTTGWDHWMRLSSTSKGRECVVPRINRSRHANAHGTNVRDNRPFERFTFEREGVDDFGDLSYLLQQQYEERVEEKVQHAVRRSWPAAWGGGSKAGAAKAWLASIGSTELLLYTREQYRELAKALEIWAEAPRATHNGTISLQTRGGGLLLLADRRRCPYLGVEERLLPGPRDRPVPTTEGISCEQACFDAGGRCEARTLEFGNRCEILQRYFPCEAGCGHQVGPELPAYASSSSLDTYKQCLVTDIAISTCGA
ncbi:MAG: hypothetical protein SGPRY_010856, partial [Prymnesium sp.]